MGYGVSSAEAMRWCWYTCWLWYIGSAAQQSVTGQMYAIGHWQSVTGQTYAIGHWQAVTGQMYAIGHWQSVTCGIGQGNSYRTDECYRTPVIVNRTSNHHSRHTISRALRQASDSFPD